MGLILAAAIFLLYWGVVRLVERLFFRIFGTAHGPFPFYATTLLIAIYAAVRVCVIFLQAMGADTEFAGFGFAYLLGMAACAVMLVGRICLLWRRRVR